MRKKVKCPKCGRWTIMKVKIGATGGTWHWLCMHCGYSWE